MTQNGNCTEPADIEAEFEDGDTIYYCSEHWDFVQDKFVDEIYDWEEL